jgi:hypothetical protein
MAERMNEGEKGGAGESKTHHEQGHQGKHGHSWKQGGPAHWSSWDSPVGTGLFFLLSALAAAVTLHIFFALAAGAWSLTHPAGYGNGYGAQGGNEYHMMRGR